MTVACGCGEDDGVEGGLHCRDHGAGSVGESVGACAESAAGCGEWARATVYGRTGVVSQVTATTALNAWRAYVRRVSSVEDIAALVPFAGVVSTSVSTLVEPVTRPCCKFAFGNLMLIL